MCGIVGIISGAGVVDYTKRRDWMISALTAGAVRGHHATGVYAVPRRTRKDEYIYTFKKAVPGGAFVMDDVTESVLWTMDEYSFVVGHNRLATQGGLGDAQAHPFMQDNVVLVHNGTIHESNGLPGFAEYAVDSEWIAKLLTTKKETEVFSQLKGAFAVVWYDYGDKQLKVVRNDQRPLHYAKHSSAVEDTYFIASEPGMLKWLCDRHAFPIGEVKEFETEKLYTFTEGKGKAIKLEESELPFWKPPVRSSASGNWGQRSGVTYLGPPRTCSNSVVPAKPRIVVGEKAKRILSGLSVGLGSTVLFVVNNVIMNSGKSRHGNMYGTQIGGDKLPVLCTGFDQRAADDLYLFEGQVYGVDVSVDEVCLVLAKPKKTSKDCPYARMYIDEGETPTVKNITSNNSKKPKESPRKQEVPALEQDVLDRPETPWGPGWRTVRGPNGDMIELAEFDKLTAKGCAHCGDNISFKVADQLIWTHDKQPLCPDCGPNMADSMAILH